MLTLYTDGACEPRNPGGHGTYGWSLERDKNRLAIGFGYVGSGAGISNNVAEYRALLAGLTFLNAVRLFKLPLDLSGPLHVRTDSQLVVRQVTGEWRCSSPHLIPLRDDARRLVEMLGAVLAWIPREQNEYADGLSRKALALVKAGDWTRPQNSVWLHFKAVEPGRQTLPEVQHA